MANTVYGPYAKTAWVDGVTMGNQTRLNNVETQAQVALNGFNPDLIAAAFVLSGVQASGTVGTTTVNISSGRAYILMSDGTFGCIVVGATTQTTSTISSTYHLYLQPDGTWYWSTSNSPAANSLNIANVTTNGSGQIATITDNRTLDMVSFLSGAIGSPGVAAVRAITRGLAIPNSTDTTVATYTVPSGPTHWVRMAMEFWVGSGNTNTGSITTTIAYTDPVSGAITTNFAQYFGATSVGPATGVAQGSRVRCMDMTAEVTAGSVVTLKYHNAAAGTIADRVTASIELLG